MFLGGGRDASTGIHIDAFLRICDFFENSYTVSLLLIDDVADGGILSGWSDDAFKVNTFPSRLQQLSFVVPRLVSVS